LIILSGLRRLNLPNCGPFVFEDFVPISDTRVLVSAGTSYRQLSVIVEADWNLENPTILARGKYLRLGHLKDNNLVYSEGWNRRHQTFLHETGIYYSDNAPTARLYKDDNILIDHWEGISEVGNPWIDGGLLFFEARYSNTPAPDGWWIYCSDLNGKNIKRLIKGANPCIFKEKLYYGIWNGNAFDIAAEDRQHLLSSNTYL
jgi:hypothetical protein